MHIVLGVLGIITAVYFFVIRARGAAEMTHELLDVADDVRAAARRLGFRRTKAVHPVESIEDPNTAAATVALAYLDLDGLPTEEMRGKLLVALQTHLKASKTDAEELVILARWLVNECHGASPAVTRASRKLFKLTSGDIGPLLQILTAVSSNPISDHQREALDEIKRAFRIH